MCRRHDAIRRKGTVRKKDYPPRRNCLYFCGHRHTQKGYQKSSRDHSSILLLYGKWFLLLPPPSDKNLSGEWYMNHSCRANSGGNGKDAFTIRALRDIRKGEEITYNYTEDFSGETRHAFRKFQCRCEEKQCKTIIRY